MKAVGCAIRRTTQAERPHMTSPVPSVFNNQNSTAHRERRERDQRAASLGSSRFPVPSGFAHPGSRHRHSHAWKFIWESGKTNRSRRLLTGDCFPRQVLGGFYSLPRPAVSPVPLLPPASPTSSHPNPSPKEIEMSGLTARPGRVPAQGQEAGGAG